MLRMTPAELKLLKRLADKVGLSAADLVRQLIRRETSRPRVRAWVRPLADAVPLKVFREGGSHWYILEQLRDVGPSDRAFRLLASHGQEIEEQALITQEWFKAPKAHRFILDGSPLRWSIGPMFEREITLHFETE
jgi:hypothetical protein